MVKKWKFQGGGVGDLCEIPSVVGVWIFSGTTQFSHWPPELTKLFNKRCPNGKTQSFG